MLTKRFFVITLALLSGVATAAASDINFKWYGFIRNYFAYDSRECKSGTADLFTYLPLDTNMSDDKDLNAVPSFTYSAITSRLGLDVTGYEYQSWKMGAKIETDFYAGLTGVSGTATMRLRQAYLTLAKNDYNLKIGQAWHPMAADIPDVIALNAGAPFGPFNRSPLVQFDYQASDLLSLTAAAIWQMQYTSAGPSGNVADYMKYSMTPELYLGVNLKSDDLVTKIGANMLSIKPRHFTNSNVKASDRITTFGLFAYLSYTQNLFSVKAKSYYGQGGEHLNLNSGYAIALDGYTNDGSWNYTPYTNSSSWISFKYGKTLQPILFLGYVKNFGTRENIFSTNNIYFSKNSDVKMNQMYRISPTLLYNFGKFAVALEYELTSVEYGAWDLFRYNNGLAVNNLHWVTNHRFQLMLKFSF